MSQSYNTALLNQILSQYTNGDKINASNKLRIFIKENPKDYTALYNYGFMCQELHKINIAIDFAITMPIPIKKEPTNISLKVNP